MSGPAVRDAFRDAWPDYAPGVPYVDSINQHPGALPAVFGSLSFEGGDRRSVTMGLNPWVTETGEVTVHIFGASGVGDTAAIAAAEAAALYLIDRDLTADVRVTSLRGPNDAAAEGEGEYFEVQITALYEWQQQA